MGRAFERRKERKFARWNEMSRVFVRIGKEIAIAVKQGGPEVDTNPRLRMAVQNAKTANMPKDRVEAAIKRASSKDEKDLQEVTYEGYAPHGVGIVVECATDNPTRTVANVRHHFSKGNGTLGTTGSLSFIFDRKGVFVIEAAGQDMELLELELIDFGLEEMEKDEEENEIVIYTDYADFNNMQKALESKNIAIKSAELQRIANDYKTLTEEQQAEVNIIIERLEDDDDVQNVYHNME